jgi:TPP-dependent pyruvate/acetoin dehydrogenase alpha subunit
MLLSRRFDEACNALVKAGAEVPHFHSGTGQEALSVAATVQLRPSDQLIYTHRGYAHLLAKRVPLEQIALDMFMKAGGTNNGLGGAMHVCRPDLGVNGREGVFGGRFGIAAGMALSARLDGRDDVVMCFYGEAAGARGILYESLNMAVLWRLPIIYIAENNGWSYSSRTDWLFPDGRMTAVWRGFDIPVAEVDGNDAEAVHAVVAAAIARARAGEGPSVIEGMTYRLDPHHLHDSDDYREHEEVSAWRERDPIVRALRRLDECDVGPSVLAEAEATVQEEVDAAFGAVRQARPATWHDSREMVAPW